jgi:glycosyltransferase involved in cell wall biosynthesis
MTPSSPEVEVTAVIVAYNHAPFVEEAIASVLAQETEFEYEIVVSEDFSTDGTREIVQRLAETHADRIRLMLSERNLNDNSVLRRGLEAARGRYIALLDGDDVWTSKRKLQTQVDFLNAHPEYASCFHNAIVVYEDGSMPAHSFYQEHPTQRMSTRWPGPRSTLADIVRGNFIPACSVVLRAESCRELPDWYDALPSGDWPLHVVSAQHGDLAYLDHTMATYRVHRQGVWTMGQSLYERLSDVEDLVHVYDVLNRHLNFTFDAEVSEAVGRLYEEVGISFYRRGRYRESGACARRSVGRLRARRLARHWRAVALLVLSPLRRVLSAGSRARCP